MTSRINLLVLILLAFAACRTETSPTITAVSWGGSFGQAVHEGVHIPFTDSTGINIKVEDYNGGLAQIRAQVEIGEVHLDVVDMDIADAIRGCDEGLLERIDHTVLPPGPDGTPAADDFPAESHSECGAGSLYWSGVYAYNEENIPDSRPTTISDFFDLENFPGRRGMRRVPQVNLEIALIADGVALDQIYTVLDTPEGVNRAFAKLETIRDEVIWWEAGAQPPQMLADKEVVMTTAYNGRIFNAQVLENQPFVIVWDGQILDVGQVVVVKGTPRLEEAMKYVAFATSAESLSRIAERISYSPVRHSGMAMVTTHVVAGVEMEPHLPTSPENSTRALHFSSGWWVDHQDEMNERFSAWLAR